MHILALLLGYLGELNFSRAVFCSQEHRFFLPAQVGSSLLTFRLREHCLGQQEGGARRFLGWQSRLSSLGCTVHGEANVSFVPITLFLAGTSLVPSMFLPCTVAGAGDQAERKGD